MAERVCPWWIGYLLASPVRRLAQKPEQILAPWVREGMTALDAGCAMGFFSLPLAQLVGEKGRVVCVDLQERMLRSLARRARRAGLEDRIETRPCSPTSLGLEDLAGEIDFALAFAVVHETPDAASFLTQIGDGLAPGGRLLIAEPSGHVSASAFRTTVATAQAQGLAEVDRPAIRMSRSSLLERPR